MIDGIDAFLLDQTRATPKIRQEHWRPFTQATHNLRFGLDPKTVTQEQWEQHVKKSTADLGNIISERRAKLAWMLGVRDQRVSPIELDFIQASTISSSLQTSRSLGASPSDPHTALTEEASKQLLARPIRWSVFSDVWGEGLLIEPTGTPKMNVIALPDADQTPEQFAGIVGGVEPKLQLARILAASGCRVFVPALISRQVTKRGPPGEPGRAELTNREFVYRPAFELGRHVIGYEVQRTLALVDLLKPNARADTNPASKDSASLQATAEESLPLALVGYGEGGLIGLAASALDDRIDHTYISGYFGSRQEVWQEPICRNLFGLLNDFGDAELAALVHPRHLLIEFAPGPKENLRTQGGAPGYLKPETIDNSIREVERTLDVLGLALIPPLSDEARKTGGVLGVSLGGLGQPVSWITREAQLNFSNANATWRTLFSDPTALPEIAISHQPDNSQRQARLVQQLNDHTQKLLYDSAKVRKKYFSQLDTKNLGSFEASIEAYRNKFRDDVIGRVDLPLSPANARSRQTWDSEKWTGYEVTLDVFPNVMAYGVLLMPKDLKSDEKRPVVVCQHGLEGRPTDVFLGNHNAYHDYAAKLCERGYIVFAPQNIYIFQDRFRSLQRKANPLGLTLFSVMVPQHQQIVNWLKTLPNVDGQRIGFYGLSYGGKSAMRIPALVKDYCLSICSADFNEWILKNASTTHHFSYVWTGEYEIFEFDLGNTFNYAEMAGLICPRPFMVERGHFDGVGEDEWVGHEFAKVKNLYQAKLGIGDRAQIEWFAGPHTINGQGTFEFLDKHLKATR